MVPGKWICSKRCSLVVFADTLKTKTTDVIGFEKYWVEYVPNVHQLAKQTNTPHRLIPDALFPFLGYQQWGYQEILMPHVDTTFLISVWQNSGVRRLKVGFELTLKKSGVETKDLSRISQTYSTTITVFTHINGLRSLLLRSSSCVHPWIIASVIMRIGDKQKHEFGENLLVGWLFNRVTLGVTWDDELEYFINFVLTVIKGKFQWRDKFTGYQNANIAIDLWQNDLESWIWYFWGSLILWMCPSNL